MTDSPLTSLVRAVSASNAEYEQGLKQAVPGGVSGGPQSYLIKDGEVSIKIEIEPLPDLVIALMRLPRLQATWHFLSGTEEAKQRLLKKIDWSMKRGGG